MEKHMRMERAEAREEGKREGIKEGMKEGIKEGIRKGKTKLLQEMVERKYQKGKSAVEIAEDLEITEEEVKEFLNEMILQPQKDVQRQEKE